MITSPHNEKLKLVRKLHDRKYRERAGLFLAEGEDLLNAARSAGREPVELLSEAGSAIGGDEVSRDALDSVSALGSGTRVIGIWRQTWSPISGPVCVYLHGVSDPGNVGAIVRSAQALVEGTIVFGPATADPHSPKAVRASMGAIFSQPLARAGFLETPQPRVGLVAHGGRSPGLLAAPVTLCLGAEREGLPVDVIDRCDATVTIPLRRQAVESLNVAAAAAIALQRISSAGAAGDEMGSLPQAGTEAS